MIPVDLKDGTCACCGGQMVVRSADDTTMDVECTECGDFHTVEPDFFRDGGVVYWPAMMAQQAEEDN